MTLGATDEPAEFLSGCATSGVVHLDAASCEGLKSILIDSFAVAVAALQHPVASRDRAA